MFEGDASIYLRNTFEYKKNAAFYFIFLAFQKIINSILEAMMFVDRSSLSTMHVTYL